MRLENNDHLFNIPFQFEASDVKNQELSMIEAAFPFSLAQREGIGFTVVRKLMWQPVY